MPNLVNSKIVGFPVHIIARWRESASSLVDLVFPMLMKTFNSTTLDLDSNFCDLIGRINLLMSILNASLAHDFIIDLNEKGLKKLWNFFKDISVGF